MSALNRLKKGSLYRILFILNILAGLSLLLSYFAPFISPDDFWPLAFFGLAFPYIVLVNIIFLLLWGFLGNSRLFLSLILLIMGYKAIPNHLQVDLSDKEIPKKNMKIVSFNVRVFDLYMWSEEKTTRNKIFNFLDQEDADIVCIQEFYHSSNPKPDYSFKTLDTLKQFLKAKNYHVDYSTTLRETDNWGIITFSSYPIINRGKVNFPIENDNTCIYTDILKGEDTIRIYNAHLASIKLDKHDYKLVQNLKKNDYSPEIKQDLKLLHKLKLGFQVRSLQADAIAESIRNSPYPVIVCGDFNDTPSSYAYQTIKGDLEDSFVQKGSGMGRTYIGDFPSFRIDYILHSKEMNTYDFSVYPDILSDHYPIGAVIK